MFNPPWVPGPRAKCKRARPPLCDCWFTLRIGVSLRGPSAPEQGEGPREGPLILPVDAAVAAAGLVSPNANPPDMSRDFLSLGGMLLRAIAPRGRDNIIQ